jgi:parallel beta-helix repeat protein
VGLTIASGQPATAADVLAAVANAGTPIITNISALRALTASTTATSVFVSGYYTVADGGGGLFVRNTTDTSSTDNGGTRIIDAAGRRWFRVVLDTVSVLMFGAKGDGVADDAPAFRAAITANVAPVIVPGYGRIYLFNSTIASPYPYFLPAGVLISNINGFRLIGQGAPIIAMGNSAAGAEHFIINRCNDFYVSGLVHQGNRSNLASSVENPGYAVHSCQNFVFERLHFTGNWGGEGSMFCGDWLINGTWREINGDAVGIGFDMAFLQDCLFSDCHAKGADTNGASGTGSVGDRFWSCVYDLPGANDDGTGAAIGNTKRVTLENCSAKNFNIGAYITTGTNITLQGCRFFSNPGFGSSGGFGVVVSYAASGSFPSTGFPVQRVAILNCDLNGNGTVVAGAGILIDGSSITNSDVISDIRIQNSLIYTNNVYGVNVLGPTHISDVIIEDCLVTNNTSALSDSLLNSMVTAANPFGATLRNNPTINPLGAGITPSLPSGIGFQNSVVNVSPVPVTIIVPTQTSAYGVHVQAPNAGTLSALGTVPANSSPFTLRMMPGFAIWFDTAVPSGWTWFGD